MLKPPMNNDVIIFVDTGQKDRNGRPITTPVESKGRVRFKTNSVKTPEGTVVSTTTMIDLPHDAPIDFYNEISYVHPSNNKVYKGKIETIDDATNFAGNRIFYRTVTLA
ncbi:head-to-tail stopper [Bacillus phage vB_BceS-M2]|nr:hypothetical protein PBC5_020 [Bacillus phage PBC5]